MRRAADEAQNQRVGFDPLRGVGRPETLLSNVLEVTIRTSNHTPPRALSHGNGRLAKLGALPAQSGTDLD